MKEKPMPTHEPIVMARKPLSEKTIVENVLKHGTGAIDIDGCRIPCSSPEDEKNAVPGGKVSYNSETYAQQAGLEKDLQEKREPLTQGRFPANILCTDDALNDGVMTKSASKDAIRKAGKEFGQGSGWNDHKNIDSIRVGITDSGSKSRYFDIDAWWKKFKKTDTGKDI